MVVTVILSRFLSRYASSTSFVLAAPFLFLLSTTCADAAPPVAVCASSSTAELDASGSAPADVDDGTFDPDGNPVTVVHTPAAFSCVNLGPQTVTLTATDDIDAQQSSCQTEVSVSDPLGACSATDKCVLGKLKAASKYANCRLKLIQKMAKTGGEPSTQDIAKCRSKFDGKWRAAEGKSSASCDGGDSLTELGAFVDEATDALGRSIAKGEGAAELCATPKLVAFVASDPDNTDAVYGADDLFTLTFDLPTNTPAVGTAAEIDVLLSCDASFGDDYAGAWSADGTTLEVVVVDPTDSPPFPAIGVDRCRVLASAGLLNASGYSCRSESVSPPLAGDYGSSP